jgi:hypothetical protein
MSKAVNIVVTCTSRKKQEPVPHLRLRSVRQKTIEDRARKWIEQLSLHGIPHTAASELYCGEYWSVARSLPTVARDCGIVARIWICSAGYGLISPQSQICSYSATFSPYDRDSVTRGLRPEVRPCAAQKWWQLISKWSGPKGSELRSLGSIAREYPRVPLLVVASSDYLQAIEQDLDKAVSTLSDPDLLLIASAGIRTFGKFTHYLLPCDARLQSCLGGTRASLNIRIAKQLVEYMGKGSIGLERQRTQLKHLLSQQPPIEQYRRLLATDDQIKDFIRFELNRNGVVSRSLLLTKFRDSGRACEQSRFASLYKHVVIDEKIA